MGCGTTQTVVEVQVMYHVTAALELQSRAGCTKSWNGPEMS